MTRSAFTAIIVVPEKLNTQRSRAQVLNVARGYQSRMKKDVQQITATWDNKPEIITPPVKYAGGVIVAEVQVPDKIFQLLNNGTSIRYAHMTNPFRAKTRVRYIGSGPGIGRLAYVSRKRPPRPGIEARHFTTTITMEHEADFASDIEKVLVGDLNTWAKTFRTIVIG